MVDGFYLRVHLGFAVRGILFFLGFIRLVPHYLKVSLLDEFFILFFGPMHHCFP